jgi:hypothetical protein
MEAENRSRRIGVTLENFEVVQFKKHGIRADPLSKIIFKLKIKTDPLTIDQIASQVPVGT